MARFFINRPIFAIVISIIIVLVGLISMFSLPIAQYPQISPPTIRVSATYNGASANVINETVAQVIEAQVNGVEGMDYMSATSSDNGSYSLQVVFNVGSDGDIDSVKVQNKVAAANPSLPSNVQTNGVTTTKSSTDMAMVFSLYSPNGTYDSTFVKNYADVYLTDKIKRVAGVGDVTVFGSDYAMRIWLNPDKLSELGLTANDIITLIQEQNQQAPAGTIGGRPASNDQEIQYTGKVQGRLESIEDFQNVIIKVNSDGSLVRLKDVARVETGKKDNSMSGVFNGRDSVNMAIQLTETANAMDTVAGVKKVLEDASLDFPPDLTYTTIVDKTDFIRESVTEVVKTFVEALVLVMIIMFIFLQSWRATLIPMLAVPVSLVGAFAAFVVLGFSINTLTLFAMVLAIGLVVDDAIVVIENVERHITEDKLDPKEATRRAMDEVSGPVVAIAFTLASVFLPVAFLGGMTGILYRQFALTIAISMALSAFVALSLTPALCGILLKPHDPNAHSGKLAKFFAVFNNGFDKMNRGYVKNVSRFINKSKLSLIFLAVVIGLMGWLFKTLPSTFIPDEDQGFLIASVNMPEGTSANQTEKTVNEYADTIQKLPGMKNVMAITGYDILTSASKSSAGTLFVGLSPWEDRKTAETQIGAEIGAAIKTGAQFPQASIIAMNPPSLPGLGTLGGFNLQLQDMSGHSDEELNEIAQKITATANQRPELQSVYTTFQINTPNYQFNIDRDKVKQLGVSLSDVFNALQVNFGGYPVNDFNKFGKTYKVMLQADTGFRGNVDSTRFIYVKNSAGEMIPLNTLLKPQLESAPTIVTRFNAAKSITIQGSAKAGYSSGQAMDAIQEVVKQAAPSGFETEWSSQSREEAKAGNTTTQVMILALVFVFLCLAALYESWSVPYAVLLSVPTGIFGALLSEMIMSQQNSVYMQIGIIMLIGLAAKNAILIVEFAKVRTDAGMPIVKAALEAAHLRLRPILMTSLAFIIGCLPLAIATGAGAGARNNMGIAVVGGMFIATLFGIFLIPVLFVVVEKIAAFFTNKKQSHKKKSPDEYM
ncbi:efflux RND transporter permease subunit [Pectinatus cerevisiiphilus]|uniref:HAE1 family hydrophobic/amphiphilic exporter-1 n=1 Tax=Pectinatus cerevisiiphilus TaxID=86956 RepID=A0A4R3K6F7_9FIRM|nr:multidrug efflux RND transporter permease subunit [Pectinatus cerevisiiphilus]TCS78399.1 HAE1 family hydrophobic/amphiphilic exporter-1 [Pectinatus cerevisiiphilus]